MQIVTISGEEYVVGLEWYVLDSALSPKKAVQDTAKSAKHLPYGLLIKAGPQTGLGLSAKSIKAPSAAVLLAKANQAQTRSAGNSSENWVMIESVGGEFWLGATANGVPLPGTDFVGSWEVVSEKISDFLSVGGFEFFSTAPEAERLIKGGLRKQDFATVVSGITQKEKFQKLQATPMMIVGVMGIFFLVCAAGYGYYHHLQTVAEHKRAVQRYQQAMQEYEKAKKNRESAIANYKLHAQEAIVEARVKALTTVGLSSNKDIMSEWEAVIYSFPISAKGWNFETAKCDLGGCVLRLKRTRLANNRMILGVYPTAKILGDNVEIFFPVKAPKLSGLDDFTVAAFKEIQVEVMSDWQNLEAPTEGLVYEIADPKEVIIPIAKPRDTDPEGALPASDAPGAADFINQLHTGWYIGNVSLSGPVMWSLRTMGQYLPTHKVAPVSLLMDNTGKWTLQVAYVLEDKHPTVAELTDADILALPALPPPPKPPVD